MVNITVTRVRYSPGIHDKVVKREWVGPFTKQSSVCATETPSLRPESPGATRSVLH